MSLGRFDGNPAPFTPSPFSWLKVPIFSPRIFLASRYSLVSIIVVIVVIQLATVVKIESSLTPRQQLQ